MWPRLRRSVSVGASRIWSAVCAELGAQELLLIVALGTAAYALWPVAGRLSLLLPALVMLWIVLPQRTAFVSRVDAPHEGDRS